MAFLNSLLNRNETQINSTSMYEQLRRQEAERLAVRLHEDFRPTGPSRNLNNTIMNTLRRGRSELQIGPTSEDRLIIPTRRVLRRFITDSQPTPIEIERFISEFYRTSGSRIVDQRPNIHTHRLPTNHSYETILSAEVEESIEVSTKDKIVSKISVDEILRKMPCCLYGSRALLTVPKSANGGDSTSDDRDYDIAISIEDPQYLNFIKYLESVNVRKVNIKNYCESTPESGYYGLYRFKDRYENNVDLLVLYLDEDVDIIRSTINDLKRIPPYFLTNKKQRIAMYNQGLRYRGWKPGVKVRNDYRTSEDDQAYNVRNWASQATTSRNHTVNYTGTERSANPWAETFGPRGAEEW